MRVSIVLLLATGCTEYDLDRGEDVVTDPIGDADTTDPLEAWTGDCDPFQFGGDDVPLTDACTDLGIGGFEPVVEWTMGSGRNSRATVAVGDLDKDGMPEIVANIGSGIMGRGDLVVMRGDGSETLWTRPANLGYAAAPAIGDLDNDGWAEVVAVREYASSLMATGDYTIVAYDHTGALKWESAHFVGLDFDYATAVHISDMDHDGSPEVVAGRVILRADGTTRGKGSAGRGSYGITSMLGMTISEASVSAVADLDLDGVEEVIVGNARYSPDGVTVWSNPAYNDGMVSVGNLDADPQGEFVAVTGNQIRAVDTNGSLLWGPLTIESANILAPAAIADIDVDGAPEILTAGGDRLLALEADGSILWEAPVTDMSGASGASVFDFEGDGFPEVVYIDEVEMAAYDGRTGALKFHTDEHSSDTMFDYAVIADVDADGHAEIVVGHVMAGVAVSIYGDAQDSWAPARQVWNQHAWCGTNINDDLSVPIEPTPGFSATNTWHAGMDRAAGEALEHDLAVEILDTCDRDCDQGALFLAARVRNASDQVVPAGLPVTLYAIVDGAMVVADVRGTSDSIAPGRTGPVVTFQVDADLARSASSFRARADDDGTGTGLLPECDEANNTATLPGPLCD